MCVLLGCTDMTRILQCLAMALFLAGSVHAIHAADSSDTEPWLKERLEWFQDQKLGFMMHWGIYSQWGCIESWPLDE